MQFPVLTRNTRNLARSAAVVALAAVAAGCSSDLMRFQDHGVRSNAALQPAQQFPGDPMAQSSLDPTYTGTVSRQGTQRSELLGQPRRPQPQGSIGNAAPAQQPFPAAQAPVQPFPGPSDGAVTRQPMASALPPAGNGGGLDGTVTGTTPVQPAPAQVQQPAGSQRGGGWSQAGGTQLTVRQGETVYSLARRFGVPVEAILQANGMSDAGALQAGQNIVIPTYAYSRDAAVSAPDSNRQVANARPVPGGPETTPSAPPAQPEQQGVLPQPPRLGDRQPQEQQPVGATAPATGSVYTVVAGDTLSSIARRTGSTTAAIKQANGLDGGLIRIGQRLTIPGAAGAPRQVAAAPASDPVTTGATPQAPAQAARQPAAQEPQPAAQPREADNVIREAARDAGPAPDATGIAQLRWPARGRVVSAFGSTAGGSRNDGIDIAVPEGTPVRAAENGLVIYAGDGLREFGNTVLVRHENGLVTVYGHASELKVSRGDTVRRGQEIALSGISGNAESPRLHFEVRKDSVPVDPTTYLE